MFGILKTEIDGSPSLSLTSYRIGRRYFIMRPILITTTRLKHNKVMYRVVDLAMLQVKTRGQLGTARRRSATLSPRPASDQKASIQYALTPAFISYPI